MQEDPMQMYRTVGQVLASILRIAVRCGAFALGWAVAWGLVYAAIGIIGAATFAQAIPEMSLRQGILAGAFWMGVFGLVHGLASGGTFGLLEGAFHRWFSVPAAAVAGLIAAWLPLSELLSSVGPLRTAPLRAVAAIALLSTCSGIASYLAAKHLAARRGARIRTSDPSPAPAGSSPGIGIG